MAYVLINGDSINFHLLKIMIKHNFKIAIRNLWKSKLTTSINLIGITIGLTTKFTPTNICKPQIENG